MKEFLLVFRADWTNMPKRSPEEMQARTQKWLDWVGGIASQNKLVDRGNRLVHDGKTVKSGGIVADGPYMETKEFVGGYSLVKASSYDEAVELAKSCPVLLSPEGTVEVREISPL